MDRGEGTGEKRGEETRKGTHSEAGRKAKASGQLD